MRVSEKEFSLKYIQIIEDVLDLHEVKHNPRPKSKVEELSGRLEAHFSVWQKGALDSIQNRNDTVSFHFGNSNQLSTTLEYAPLYVDHVVLQDLVLRILQSKSLASKKLRRIRLIGDQLVSWRPLVEEGIVSIIPSPIFWDQHIEEHLTSLSTTNHQFAVPLYASLLLGCSPMTDVPELARELPNIANSSVGREIANTSASSDRSPNIQSNLSGDHVYYQNMISELQHGDVIDVLPLLLGNDRVTQNPELWCLKDPDPERLLELSSEFSGFRTELNSTVDQITSSTDHSDIYSILEQSSKQVTDEYMKIKRKRQRYRKSRGKDTIKIVLQSVPLLLGINSQDMLLSVSGASLIGIQLQELYEKWDRDPPGENNTIFRTFKSLEIS